MNMIKLLGAWHFHSEYAERYYAVYYYLPDSDTWVVGETGWERIGIHQDTEVRVYCFNPWSKNFVQYTPRGIQFNFSDYDEYIVNCSLSKEDLFEETPCPSWATACELIDN